ncbi:phenol 2-monooxygenase [Pseudovirgaria hyperparasitica]|uniref:Phenol 2-monooxygenase n=1 Tax=Pseudovirgaria hyperparasitica TaxID=470096 RepID=A0A6A6W639_9PEZI|nr:phenol 2-monooxygenase [Pseudovirgaria hyperparasitica]KAF2757406.1 phenol 2-monooxygenase [Pseudovirgaria hyperparasitica]
MPPTQRTDVLIVGSGSAGICAALWLTICNIPFRILDKRPVQMAIGQADGVQCRTVEVFESFGVAEDLLREAFHILEVSFWSMVGEGISRTGRIPDTKKGLSHMPHVILNQAQFNGILLDKMRQVGAKEVEYGWEVKGVTIDQERAGDYGDDVFPVQVFAEKEGQEHVIEAKYVLGCDGAHSTIRRSLGHKMLGDSSDTVWGVMDIYPQTSFPDIRKKSTIHSTFGNIVIIPREGGSLVRLYIELPAGTDAKTVQLSDLHATAKAIFMQYPLEIAETLWWSAYTIGQRLVDRFSAFERVYLTGDACHTHSPKAGQGMNVSLQDGYNIGWKLAHVLSGRSPPSLLRTYDVERQKVAADLIEFDRYFTKLFSLKHTGVGGDDAKIAAEFSQGFEKSGRFTAGLTSRYEESMITGMTASIQELASGLPVGMRFPSAQVVRFCDARAMQLVRAFKADGRWRVVVFAGDITESGNAERLSKFADFLSSPTGPVRSFTRESEDIDSFIEPILVLRGDRTKIEQEHIPDFFWPATGKWRVRDLHKTYIDDDHYNSGHGYAYEAYGIATNTNVVAIVRPDQHIALVVPTDDHKAIYDLFAGFCIRT